MGGKFTLVTLLFVLVPIKGNQRFSSAPNDKCQLSSFSPNEFTWNLRCLSFSKRSYDTHYVLTYSGLSFEFIQQNFKWIAKQMLQLYFIERVYDPLYHLLSWLENVAIAVKNNVTKEIYPCQNFNSNSFKEGLQTVWYETFYETGEYDGPNNLDELRSLLQDLPITVLTDMNGFEYSSLTPTLSELEGVLSQKIQNIFHYLGEEHIYETIIDMSEQTSSYLLSVLSETLDNINSLLWSVSWYDKELELNGVKTATVCIQNVVNVENNVRQSLQVLTHALLNSSSSVMDLAVNLFHLPDRTAERDDQQTYLKSTSSDGVYSTQNSKKAVMKRTESQDDGTNSYEGSGKQEKTTVLSDNVWTTYTTAAETYNAGNKDGVTYDDGRGDHRKEKTTITAEYTETANTVAGPEYHAHYNLSRKQPFVLDGHGNDEFSVEVTFHATPRGFEGVKKDDVKIIVENMISFQNEANIGRTVKEVTASSIVVRLSVDSSAEWNFTIEINGQRVLKLESSDPLVINMKVLHRAPECKSHRFTDLGNAIQFGFDVPINVTRTAEGGCKDFFEDVSNLGDGATCEIKTRLIEVTIGRGSDLIVPGRRLGFKRNVIRPARQLFYQPFYTHDRLTISPPNTAPTLSFIITGPATINRCGTYKLRAEQISGHGGRPVTYQWQLPEEFHNTIAEGELYNQGNSRDVFINAVGVKPGSYSLPLTITNFLQQKRTRHHNVTVLADIKPVLEIKPLNVIPNRVRASSRVKLEAVVTFSFGDNCETTGNVTMYEWSSSDGIIIPEKLRKNRILVLPPNTLPVGRNIHITVKVFLNGENEATSVTEGIQLTTIASPLVAKIIGASTLTVGRDQTVTLNGSRSHDPNEIGSESLNFRWACAVRSSGGSCGDFSSTPRTSSVLTIKSSQFRPGIYSISLEVSKDKSSASASVTLIVKNDDVPLIRIKTVKGETKYRHDRSIYIQANVKSSSNVTIDWREENDRLRPERRLLVRKQNEFITHVKIPSDQLTPGSQYTIEVHATDENGKTGLATLNLVIYKGITQCEVDATKYKEMSEITITATGCVADPDLEPLTYQPVFALPFQNGYKKIVLDGSKSDSIQKIIASPINYNEEKVYLGFMICDASSTCIDELQITDYEATKKITLEQQQEYITHNVDNVLEKGDIATAFRNVINIANLLKKTSLPTSRRRRNVEFEFTVEGNFDSVLLVVNDQTLQVSDNNEETQFELTVAAKQAQVFLNVAPVDVNEGALISDLSSQMLISKFTEEEIDGVLSTIQRILVKATDEGSSYSKDTIERLLTSLKMIEQNMKANGKETKERRDKARKVQEMALKQAGSDLNIDEHVTFDVSGTQMFVAYSFPKHDVTLTNSSVHLVNVRLGRNLSNSYGYDWCGNSQSETCVGIKLMATQMDSLEGKIDKCTEIFRIGLLHPVTDEQLSDLEEPIEIEMAKNDVGEGKRCVCKYWNEDTAKLDDDGVTSETAADGKLICKSRRQATYVGAREAISSDGEKEKQKEDGTPKPLNRHPAVVLGIVFGILGLIFVAVGIAVMIVKSNAKKKVAPIGKLPPADEEEDN